MNSPNLVAWIATHLDFIILIVSLMFVAPFLNALARAATPTLPSVSLWPGARIFCSVVGVAFTVVFVKSLIAAIERSNAAPHDGSAIGYVALGYAWCTFWFWAAMLGFIAARKG
ncbi:MAG: hypothetical protein WAW96_18730 [Alphaproteobacteria bacterium]